MTETGPGRAIIIILCFTGGGFFLGLAIAPPRLTPVLTYPIVGACTLMGLLFGVGVALATERD